METNFPVWPGWETVRLIGRGSFGAVYEIERDVFGHKESAALKMISIPQSSGDIDELYDSGYDEQSVTATFKAHMKSIVNEYSLMREMNGSANVVNCDDFRTVEHDDGIGWDIFIKMELLTPLTKAMGKDISESEAVKIGVHMCNALVLCKKYGIVHRDIKPQNIFVSRNGDYKLGDFGIAKTVEHTMGGTKIGTYKYMAPEVYNNQPYGAQADIYSLGLVLHWLLNERRAPFMPLPPEPATASQEESARLRRFSGEAIPAPKNSSEELKRIVLRACEYDPEKRYKTAEEMRADLLALAGVKEYGTPAAEQTGEQVPDDEEVTVSAFAADNGSDNHENNAEAAGTETDETETVGVWGKSRGNSAVNLQDDGGATVGVIGKAEKQANSTHEMDANPASDSTVAETAAGKKFTSEQKKKKHGFVIGAVGAIALAAVVCFFTIHIWDRPTCTAPETCKICHKTTGTALGHEWVNATPDQPKTCKRCGEEIGNPLPYSDAEPISMHYYEEMYYDQTYILDYDFLFEHDSQGRITTVSEYDSNNDLVAVVEQKYDSEGNCTAEYSLGTNFEGVYLYLDYNTWENGHLIRKEELDGMYVDEYETDENGKPIKCYNYENGQFYMEDTFSYDEQGRASTMFREQFGNWSLNVEYSYIGNSKDPYYIKWGDNYYMLEYEYDEAGRLIKEVEAYYHEGSLFSVMTKTYAY